VNLDRILASAPINKTAARVTGIRRGIAPAGDMTRDELVELMDRLQRKLRLLKVVLRIDTKAKHKNLVYKATHGMRSYRGKANPRAVDEYIRVGHEIQRMNRTLQAMRAERKGLAVVAVGGWEGQSQRNVGVDVSLGGQKNG
jgi:hypothetical protein